MADDDVRTHQASIGEDTLHSRTGRTREEWFSDLDAAGAAGWAHRDIAAWLVRERGVEEWWAQSLAVGYEQARGLRAPGQRPDGTFEANTTKIVPLGVASTYRLLSDPAQRTRWLDMTPVLRGTTEPTNVRWDWPDGSRVTVRLEDAEGRTRVAVQHHRLGDAEALAVMKGFWRDRLAQLALLEAEDSADSGGPQ